MNWGYVFAWAAALLGVFFLTGWPVSPNLKGYWGNHYNEKNLMYYTILYIHHFLGAHFFTFLALGMFRNLIWKGDKGGNRQLAFVLAYSVLVAAAIAVYLTHQYSPVESNDEEAAVVADQAMTNDDKA